jgi:hypothetical protein
MGDINVTDPIEISSIDQINNIAPVTIASINRVSNVAPVAVHIKELNHIDPLLIDSARIDALRNIDPLRVDRLNVTTLPMVNLSVNQVPNVDLNVKRIPPVAIGINQSFDLPSDYTARARFLGFEVLRVHIQGTTRMIPRDCVRREQAHTHERSFAEVAAVGNPAIPNRMISETAETRHCAPPAQPHRQHSPLSVGPPRFQYGGRPRGPSVRSG